MIAAEFFNGTYLGNVSLKDEVLSTPEFFLEWLDVCLFDLSRASVFKWAGSVVVLSTLDLGITVFNKAID